MRKAIIILCAVLFSLSVESCEKCIRCTFDSGTMNYDKTDCGSARIRKLAQDEANEVAGRYGTTATCVEE